MAKGSVRKKGKKWYYRFYVEDESVLPSIGGNIRVGHSETFLTEACEYTNSFLSFFPKIGIILNMDADHLDFFKDIDDIRHSFREFAQLLPADGALIIYADTPLYQDFIKDL